MGRRRYSSSPSPRGYSSRSPRSRTKDLPTSLLVRNLRHDCRPEDLRGPFGEFGPLKDVYLPRDYYTGQPRGFGFVQYVDPDDAAEAKYEMDGQILHGRELTVMFAEENRKKPSEMRARHRVRRSPVRYSRSPLYERSRSPSPRYARTYSRSRDYSSRSISPRKSRYRGRSHSRSSYSRSSSRSPVMRSRSWSKTPEPY